MRDCADNLPGAGVGFTLRQYRGMTRAGLTLVEVMAAMVVLGVGLVAVMGAFSACSRVVSIVKGQVVAETFASKMLSELRVNPQLLLGGKEGIIIDGPSGFTWTRELRETGEPGVLAVKITVNWKSQGVRRYYALTSLVATPRF